MVCAPNTVLFILLTMEIHTPLQDVSIYQAREMAIVAKSNVVGIVPDGPLYESVYAVICHLFVHASLMVEGR